MTQFVVRDMDRGNEREFETKSEAQEAMQDLAAMGADVELETRENGTDADVVEPEETPTPEPEPTQEPVEADVIEPKDLSENPIDFLRSVNSEFVNTIKGTPAISKRGFRFIQREFDITTETEVVQWNRDPLGCVVWARAELNDEYAAEAHGEGWQFETQVDDNEFVRYADTRAKNRAISDLTSAGALAVSELTGEE